MVDRRTRVAIICDPRGEDDEGMKKVARRLCSALGAFEKFDVSMISTGKCLLSASDFDLCHFIGGPTLKTVLVAYVCRRLNRALKTVLTFTNPVVGRISLSLLSYLKPDLCIVSSRKWQGILDAARVPVRMLNVSGVDVSKFSPVHAEAKRVLRAGLGWPR